MRHSVTDREGALAALLAWYRAAGVDEAVADQPVNRLETPRRRDTARPTVPASGGASSPAPIQESGVPAGRAPEPPATAQTAATARAAAQAANSPAELARAVAEFDGCPLKTTATNTVFARGSGASGVMVVGEAPGAEEDRQGLPFVGPSGRLLDQMLASIGLDPAEVTVTNILFWRPPGNRDPSGLEVAACLPFVHRHIELVRPRLMLLLGAPAARTLLDRKDSLARLRGRWTPVAGIDTPVPALATFHPAYLLRNPEQKRLAWRDLLRLRARLAEDAGAP